MMMRHLFLDSLKAVSDTGCFPVMVILRKYGLETTDFLDLIVQSASRFDPVIDKPAITNLLKQGKCQLLLDGLDEIRPADLKTFLSQLDYLMDYYPDNQIVISSRKISSFISLSRFLVLWMEPFSPEQSLELIDKLKFCEGEPRLKQTFRERLIKEYFKTHKEFVSNPLLLTLMLMNFRRFSDVPEKKHLFYRQAYDTLLQRHDADKLAYNRVFHSVKDPSDFTLVFSEFCARSYRLGDYDFDRTRFGHYFEKLKCRKKLASGKMTLDNFIYDACSSTCLMYEETQEYHFLHRSFQEYFFADYYSRKSDRILKKLGWDLRDRDQFIYDDTNALNMLYELAPDRVEQLILLPFLEDIFSGRVGHDSYWQFLLQGYDSITYAVFHKELLSRYHSEDYIVKHREQLLNAPSNILVSQICKILGLSDIFYIDTMGLDTSYQEARVNIIVGSPEPDPFRVEDVSLHNTSVFILPVNYLENSPDYREQILDTLLKDPMGNPLEFGGDYVLDLELLVTHPERYTEIRSVLEAEEFTLCKIYKHVEEYYNDLKMKYDETADLDDDDY